ncbi:MAG TPA: biotin/lipoyl-containing protein [Dehalococcoidia bacterium]|nr:biotin/lipoyl-containing protein [Dehalococcoidia bacterium]
MATRYIVVAGGQDHEAQVSRRGGGLDIVLDGEQHRVRLVPEGPPQVYLLTDSGTRHEVGVEREQREVHVVLDGRRYRIGVYTEGQRRAPGGRVERASERELEGGAWTLLSPMVGLVLSVHVKEGEVVEPGDILIVIEAMKMNNEMRALRRSRVQRIHVLPGDRIEQGADLITFEAADSVP